MKIDLMSGITFGMMLVFGGVIFLGVTAVISDDCTHAKNQEMCNSLHNNNHYFLIPIILGFMILVLTIISNTSDKQTQSNKDHSRSPIT